MRHMQVNQTEITVVPKKRNHPGFVDCEGNELEPGDIVAFGNTYGRTATYIITRFTPRRAYFVPMYVPPASMGAGCTVYPYEWSTQLVGTYTQRYQCFGPDAERMLHRLLKIEEV